MTSDEYGRDEWPILVRIMCSYPGPVSKFGRRTIGHGDGLPMA